VRGLSYSADDLTIVKVILGLAKAFDLSVVAEGVETRAHGLKLQQFGCKLAQGTAVAKAMLAGIGQVGYLTGVVTLFGGKRFQVLNHKFRMNVTRLIMSAITDFDVCVP